MKYLRLSYLLVLLALVGLPIGHAQIFIPPINVIPKAPTGYTGPGDVVASATGWWGLRAYSSATRGTNAANVCIPADATCADLVTDATTGALIVPTIGGSSCGVVTCTVKTLYDQSGNGNNLTNATIANRPVLNTTASPSGAGPGMVFTAASSQRLSNTVFTFVPQPASLIAVAKSVNNSAQQGLFSASSSQPQLSFRNPGDNTAFIFAGTVLSRAATDGSFHTLVGVANGASSSISVDGATTSGAGGAGVNAQVFLGNDGGAGNYFNGTAQEAGAWASAFSAGNISGMDSNQRTFWGF